MPRPVVAIVGRPNVGKSTLFNRIVGSPKATVHDRPGVTRDRLYEEAEALGRRFLVIDTGGLEPRPDTPLLEAMRLQSLVAVEEADVILFVVDARGGLTPADEEVAELLRRSHKPVVLAVNKIDGPRHEDLSADFWALGLVPLVTLSATHGRGMYDLMEQVVEALPEPGPDEVGDPDELTLDEAAPSEIRIAVLGKPNVGKSTLVNALLGEERHLVHDSPGTTMDPVDSPLEVGDRRYLLVDTAGVRRRSRIEDRLERHVSLQAIRSIERCHVCLLVIDGTLGPSDQDARLAQLVADRGRALLVLVNKWDLVKDMEGVNSHTIEDQLDQRLPHVTWAPRLFIAAHTGKGLHRVLPAVESVYAQFDRRISTSRLNRFLEDAVTAHTPPQRHHRPVRLYFATQARVRPPTLVFFSNTPDGIGKAYQRYLANRLRTVFGFEGTPLRLHFRRRRKPDEPVESQ